MNQYPVSPRYDLDLKKLAEIEDFINDNTSMVVAHISANGTLKAVFNNIMKELATYLDHVSDIVSTSHTNLTIACRGNLCFPTLSLSSRKRLCKRSPVSLGRRYHMGPADTGLVRRTGVRVDG